MSGKYDDMINLPHHVSEKHQQISLQNRAAQFAPFAAVVGYDAAVMENARVTEARVVLDEDQKVELNSKLRKIIDEDIKEITVTHFRPDEKKDGGAYVAFTGIVKKIDDFEKVIVFKTGERISIENILAIDL